MVYSRPGTRELFLLGCDFPRCYLRTCQPLGPALRLQATCLLVRAELGEEGLRLAHDGGGWKGLRDGRRWRRTRSALRGRLGWGVLVHQPVDLKAGHG